MPCPPTQWQYATRARHAVPLQGVGIQDEENIYQTIKNAPKQFLESWDLVRRQENLFVWNASPAGRIYFAAMGGSSFPGDLLNDHWAGNPRMELVRDYRLPPTAGPQDLAIVASFSGNTEETLSAFEDAVAKGCRVLAISNAGKLRQMAAAAHVPWVHLPDCIQPRCAVGNIFSTVLSCLYRLGRIPSPETDLRRLAAHLETIQESAEATGKALAESLTDRVPIIYGPTEFTGVCRVWKIKFNENAKVQSFYNVFPELNHNEMVGFTRLLMQPALIFLESRWMHPRIARRMDVLETLLKKEMPIFRVRGSGGDLLQERFESLTVADYATYHLAKRYGIDPAPVPMVEEFKKLL